MIASSCSRTTSCSNSLALVRFVFAVRFTWIIEPRVLPTAER